MGYAFTGSYSITPLRVGCAGQFSHPDTHGVCVPPPGIPPPAGQYVVRNTLVVVPVTSFIHSTHLNVAHWSEHCSAGRRTSQGRVPQTTLPGTRRCRPPRPSRRCLAYRRVVTLHAVHQLSLLLLALQLRQWARLLRLVEVSSRRILMVLVFRKY